jgi:hypothetical protein
VVLIGAPAIGAAVEAAEDAEGRGAADVHLERLAGRDRHRRRRPAAEPARIAPEGRVAGCTGDLERRSVMPSGTVHVWAALV